MTLRIIIRDETDSYLDAINEVTIAAFKTLQISNQTEHFIVQALRAANGLTLSLVDEMDGRMVVTIFTHYGIPTPRSCMRKVWI